MEYILNFPTPIEEVDIIRDNIDVCLQLSNGCEYTLVIATPDGLKDIIRNEGVPYIRPCVPILIVETITLENIRNLVEDLLNENKIFLEVYGGDLMMS